VPFTLAAAAATRGGGPAMFSAVQAEPSHFQVGAPEALSPQRISDCPSVTSDAS
jgi:hypothetical protein